MDQVRLRCDLDCIVGLLPWERHTPQRLEVEIELAVDLGPCARTGELALSVDYGEVDAMVRGLAGAGRFVLIETLALALLRWLLAPVGPGEARAAPVEAAVRLSKPGVMPRALPSVRLVRRPEQLRPVWRELKPGVRALELADLAEVRAWRVTVEEGCAWTPEPGEALLGAVVRGPRTVLALWRQGQM